MSIIISILSGALTSIGLGGGTLLIIGLTMFLGLEQKIAQSINLIFFIPTAITSIWINTKEKRIKWNFVGYIIGGSIIGAIIGSLIAININIKILRKLFGIFIGIIAIYEIYKLIKTYNKIKKSNNKINNTRKEDVLEKDI